MWKRDPYGEQERRWKEDYAKSLNGHAPPNFDADEYREFLEGIGREAGWLKPPPERDAFNAAIRVQSGHGTAADREILAMRERAHGEGKGG